MEDESTTSNQLELLKDHYPMNKKILGNVYIFNHVLFDNRSLGARYGNVKDCQDIEEVFHRLKFKVKIYKDLSYKEILETLSKISDMDYSNFDCLVFFILTHGRNGKIFARDIDYYPHIYWNSFNKPSFMNKPKLIFVQDPRGDEIDDETHYGIRIPPSVHNECLAPDSYTIPDIPDVLLMHSCHDGLFSWRSLVTGSSFVQHLCREIKLRSKSIDLLTLLTFLNQTLYVTFDISNNKKKHATIVSTLTKVFYGDYYPLTKEKLGNVYIFNHVTFDNGTLGPRYAGIKDCQDIEKVFQKLKFNVETYDDLSYNEILKKLSKIAEMDYSNFDCLIIFVLTHGENGKVFARDVGYYPDIYWKSFTNKPSFMYKPKLIFIQDSRGDETDDESRYGIITPKPIDNEVLEPTGYPLPDVPDVLVMYSCYDGFFSWRTAITGTSFVQRLCLEFKYRSKPNDIITLLTLLNQLTTLTPMNRHMTRVSNIERRHSTIISTLTRVLVL
ncbi:hypothetical protein RN001_014562 [Aquatica leii]|uniref:Uncharacterized protein n=1 Tax=Aquatica leii TaxID=1421715 RepID=A0AAN7SKL8_9COLE|nr:hypothetical protein RN001_014562 [Aquatica leii]